MPKVKIAELILDFNLYPRNHVEQFNVHSIARALEAGFKIPAVVADHKTKKVVDGFNRITAVKLIFGDDADIDVEWREYKNERAIFEDAMLLNSAHGERLNSLDMARCAIIADQLKIDQQRLAECLHAKPEWLESLRRRKVAEGPDGPIPVKGTLAHLAKAQNDAAKAGGKPKPFTARQVRANNEASGMPWYFLIDKAISILEAGLVPMDHPKALHRMKWMQELVNTWVKKAERVA